uniref:Uncharacterized protein n=1 Tax=Arundo donax TaxID=35708 RepID=A0A0A8YYE7_ARUDO
MCIHLKLSQSSSRKLIPILKTMCMFICLIPVCSTTGQVN